MLRSPSVCTAGEADRAGCPAAATAGGRSLGQCAAIGVGMAAAMVAVGALAVVAWRWWRRRVQQRYAVQEHELTTRLMLTERLRDELEVEGASLISTVL